MRILAGKYRGKKISTITQNFLRPTTSKTREAIFNILENNSLFSDIDFHDSSFLELFCGSAIVSFEAYSRGFKKITLIDKNPLIRKLFEKNLEIFNAEDFAFVSSDVSNLPQALISSDVCFFDPPYDLDIVQSTLEQLSLKNWLNENALVIVEMDKRNSLQIPKNFNEVITKIYGKTKLIFLRYHSS